MMKDKTRQTASFPPLSFEQLERSDWHYSAPPLGQPGGSAEGIGEVVMLSAQEEENGQT